MRKHNLYYDSESGDKVNEALLLSASTTTIYMVVTFTVIHRCCFRRWDLVCTAAPPLL